MKKPLLLFVLFVSTIYSGYTQTIDSEYLNPKITANPNYKFLRFGGPSEYIAGFMWNIQDVTYGDGDDFSLFTYNNRDMTFRTGTGNFIVFPVSGGKVGIGTIEPKEKLDVNGSLKLGGNSGVTINPDLDVSTLNPGATLLASSFKGRKWGHTVVDIYGNDAKDAFAIRTDRDYDGVLDDIPFIVNNAGSVGIGTTNPGSWKLAVNGNIRAKEIKVETGWSDFVFEEHYSLPTLEEVEQHIKEKGHLKDIPSAREVEENGILLGEMDAKLLQKIEELTLYMIDLKKENKEQKFQIEELLKQNSRQQEEIDQLKKQ